MPTICSYDPRWPLEFSAIAHGLRTGLGGLALRIDHIGSTAVPGLCAKDVIDVQLSVASLGDTSLPPQISALGFERYPGVRADHCPPCHPGSEADWCKLFFLQPAGKRRINLHVREAGRTNQRYALLFRDYLRAHPPTAAAYGQLKQRLAAGLANGKDYPDVKDPAVDLIYFAAQAWAQAMGWTLPPSDA
ncbi:GrpB family protein [Paucibacter soli]|uniref:GrpB family protein n=1 Tax=Paucibacter soli TaxID=3133433 RepID=UPI0030B74F4B